MCVCHLNPIELACLQLDRVKCHNSTAGMSLSGMEEGIEMWQDLWPTAVGTEGH